MLLRLATRSESCDRARIELKKLALALVHAWIISHACGFSNYHGTSAAWQRARHSHAGIGDINLVCNRIRARARRFRNPTCRQQPCCNRLCLRCKMKATSTAVGGIFVRADPSTRPMFPQSHVCYHVIDGRNSNRDGHRDRYTYGYR